MVGKDVDLDKVLDLSESALVGKFSGGRVSMNNLIKWMDQIWCVKLDYVPVCHLLEKGWCGFIFQSKEVTLDILKDFLFMDSSSLSLKPWHPLFDVATETMGQVPVWVKLLRLPMEFWLVV